MGATRKVLVFKDRYYDSVFLMQVARRIASQPGMQNAFAVLATDANRGLLARLTFEEAAGGDLLAAAGPGDLVIALEGEAPAVAAVAADPEAWLARPLASEAASSPEPRSIAEAARLRPDAGLAVISVPGQHAVREARAALREGLSVFLFSSNISREDELSLKTAARERGLIVMGPDCGTAYVAGAGIGFANAVRRGPIGVVGSTGTGMQELSCLVHRAGSGISHGIGTGSRDLSDEVGGISTFTALDALEKDEATTVIVILSKPPGARTARGLVDRLRSCRKPVVLCLLGVQSAEAGSGVAGPREAPVRFASTIDGAAGLCLEAAGAVPPSGLLPDVEALRRLASAEVAGMSSAQRYVRGLFAGGTFCYQSQVVFRDAGIAVSSNAPLEGMEELADHGASRGHSFIDMGADEFVAGRPHPMIDASQRAGRLARELEDPAVAVILLDFILGAISAADPVGDMMSAIHRATRSARARGDHLCIAASLCGTDGDPQGYESQRRALTDAGVHVFPSSLHAASFCREAALLLAAREGAG